MTERDERPDPFVDEVRRAGAHHQMVRPSEVLARWVAARQQDPEATGLARSTLYRRLRVAGHEPTHRGLWRPAGLPVDAIDDAVAACAVAGDRALLTGQWALWANMVVTDPPARPTLLVPASRTLQVAGCRVLRTRKFADVVTRRIHTVRTAAVARAMQDYATEGASLRRVVSAIVHADRLRRCTLADVRDELLRRRRFPGRATVVRACAELDGELSHSAVERTGRRRLRRLEPAFTSGPYKVEVGGRTIAEIDLALAASRYGVEIDGPVHLWPQQQATDRARDQELERFGWTIDRFWWSQIEDDLEEVVAVVARRLRDRGWSPAGQ